MIHYSLDQIQHMERFDRANLVNCITGFKSANLLATRSKDGVDNVAIFSSVLHLGSDPALFGFVQRPLGHGAGNTYKNLKETGEISLNHVSQDLVTKAHQSSAKYDPNISEFEVLGIERLDREPHEVPFVQAAPVQVAAVYENEYFLQENKCIFVICRITDIYLDKGLQSKDGWVDLTAAGSMVVNGLDGYASAKGGTRFSYAQVGKELEKISPS
ncbi:flavin reductase family protein [Nonlabens xiamenensis]|uniref:flavin reductase family protein n=1 Tax=Nonlabens xiamenensis TaxID=2341043 RepID=UPI000F60B5D9|nr:flavin reductase [Nonlabens xiamenensis]